MLRSEKEPLVSASEALVQRADRHACCTSPVQAVPQLGVGRAIPATTPFARFARPSTECDWGEAADVPYKILVVNQDAAERQALVDYLESERMQVASAEGWRQTKRQLADGAPHLDLVVIDLSLGMGNNVGLLREIRSCSAVALVATGLRFDEIDRVVALELGADDCLAKPFSMRELLARIRAVLRPIERVRSAPRDLSRESRYRFGSWQLNVGTRRLTSPTGTHMALTRGEYDLLVAFLNAPMRVLSRLQLIRASRAHDDIADRTIDAQVVRLRRKLEIDPVTPRIIRTERGSGYVFALPVERSDGMAFGVSLPNQHVDRLSV